MASICDLGGVSGGDGAGPAVYRTHTTTSANRRVNPGRTPALDFYQSGCSNFTYFHTGVARPAAGGIDYRGHWQPVGNTTPTMQHTVLPQPRRWFREPLRVRTGNVPGRCVSTPPQVWRSLGRCPSSPNVATNRSAPQHCSGRVLAQNCGRSQSPHCLT